MRAYPTAEVTALDQELNKVYRQIMNAKPERPDSPDRLGFSTVTRKGVQVTQRAWLRYRDAFIRFAKLRYPKADTNSLTGELTKQRVGMLKEVREE